MKFLRKVSVWLGKLAVVAALVWALWWYVLAWGAEFALAVFFDESRDQGWHAEHGAVEVTGFPMSLDVRIEDIELADPQAAWYWSSPTLLMMIRTAKPTAIETHLPESHLFGLRGDRIAIAHDRMTTRIMITPNSVAELQRGSLNVAGLNMIAQSGWKASADSLTARMEKTAPSAKDNATNAYAITLSANDLEVPRRLLSSMFPLLTLGGILQTLSREIDQIELETVTAFREPMDRFAFRDGGPAIDSINIRNAELVWGTLAAQANGRIQADARGYAEGRIELNVDGWRKPAGQKRRSGPLGILDDFGELGEGLLSLFEEDNNTQARNDFTLILKGGRVWFGPLDIGTAPRIASPN